MKTMKKVGIVAMKQGGEYNDGIYEGIDGDGGGVGGIRGKRGTCECQGEEDGD
jgi:hypothetical protein